MTRDAEKSLPECQAGFRPGRGCRDWVLVLALLMATIQTLGTTGIITFLDFKAAFDSVSHLYLDSSLGKAGVNDKCRAIFRQIYEKAKGVIRVKGSDKKTVDSKEFPINCGVLQGDLLSPFCFIVAFAQIMADHDKGIESGAEILNQIVIEVLKYADDAALIDTDIETASRRISRICQGAWKDADMQISASKTEVMQVTRPEKVSPIKDEDVDRFVREGELKFKCSMCSKPFTSKKGKNSHERKCQTLKRGVYKEGFEVRSIIDVRGSSENRFFYTWWENYRKRESTWEPERHFKDTPDVIKSFWAQHPEYSPEEDIEVDGEHRCKWCCKFFLTNEELEEHQDKQCFEKKKGYSAGSRTAKVIKRLKRADKVRLKPKVRMGESLLENVFHFIYLGHFFQADGDPSRAIEVRKAKAWSRFTKLRHLWDSSIISRKTKIQLYQSAVIATLSHCHEAWILDDKTRATLGGFNAQCLSIITGRNQRTERVHPTWDLIKTLRTRRLRWLGHILRLDEDRLLRKVVIAMEKPYPKGSIMMDAPPHDTMDDLIYLAGDHGYENHKEWSAYVSKFDKAFVGFPEYAHEIM